MPLTIVRYDLTRTAVQAIVNTAPSLPEVGALTVLSGGDVSDQM